MRSSATALLLADVLTELITDGRPGPERIVVIDDDTGLADVLVDRFPAAQVRVHSDRFSAEAAIRARLGDAVQVVETLDIGLVAGADLIALDLPTSRAALDQIGRLAAAAPCPLLLGVGRVKHMTRTMNDTLRRSYGSVRGSLGRAKSRVLIAEEPRAGVEVAPIRPRRVDELDLTVCAVGGTFAGGRLDAGTRLLASTSSQWPRADRIVDLGCGAGVLAVHAARTAPQAQVIAVDESAAALRSTVATAEANGLSGRIEVERADGLSARPDRSAGLIVCNPPFHRGAAKDTEPAMRMLADAARVLEPDGELWTVFNSHLPYRRMLRAEVGPTELITQDRSFQVLRSALG